MTGAICETPACVERPAGRCGCCGSSFCAKHLTRENANDLTLANIGGIPISWPVPAGICRACLTAKAGTAAQFLTDIEHDGRWPLAGLVAEDHRRSLNSPDHNGVISVYLREWLRERFSPRDRQLSLGLLGTVAPLESYAFPFPMDKPGSGAFPVPFVGVEIDTAAVGLEKPERPRGQSRWRQQAYSRRREDFSREYSAIGRELAAEVNAELNRLIPPYASCHRRRAFAEGRLYASYVIHDERGPGSPCAAPSVTRL